MKNRVVSIHYTLKNASGEVLDSSREGNEPLEYVEGQSQIIPGLESEVAKLKTGDKQAVKVLAKDAYGVHDKKLIMDIPKDQFPQGETIEVGDQFRMTLPNTPPRIFTVTELKPTHIAVDGNHPLAGEDLFFDIEVMKTREATEKDLEEQCCDHDHDHDHDHGSHSH